MEFLQQAISTSFNVIPLVLILYWVYFTCIFFRNTCTCTSLDVYICPLGFFCVTEHLACETIACVSVSVWFVCIFKVCVFLCRQKSPKAISKKTCKGDMSGMQQKK